jgi:pantoate--beta-alanine ligase
VHTAADLRRALDEARRSGSAIGFVPTMGALHDGHLALVSRAKQAASFVWVSIFVNPTQFGPNEDFARYPRTLDADVARCEGARVDLVFAPDAREIYPPGEQTRVRVGPLADVLCGPFRPGHFEGVATVVTKLFVLSGESTAVFGRKDYQQLRIVDRLAKDLCFPIQVVGHRTVREPDGLAMSSRNAYLSPPDRARARAIPRGLANAVTAFAKGERRTEALLSSVRSEVEPVADSIDYVSLNDPETLVPLQGIVQQAEGGGGTQALLALALRIGSTRLIDNVVLGEEESPIR